MKPPQTTTTANYTPPYTGADTIEIVCSLSTTSFIKIDTLIVDSVALLPYYVASSFSGGGGYEYGYNGQVKVE
ncbi:MAG: hypothetical protein EBX41_04325 [Chitinophagia bacterium]|nr:hypothetical protein [Chitinophagia bacterium]